MEARGGLGANFRKKEQLDGQDGKGDKSISHDG